MNVNLTASQLREASEVATQIETLQQRLANILGGTATVPTMTTPATNGKRHLSPEAIAKIRKGQKERWKKVHEAQAVAAAAATTPAPETVATAVAA